MAESFQALVAGSFSGLARVDERIRSTFATDAPQLKIISEYLLSLGGKRVRPILALTTYKLCLGREEVPQSLIDAAAGIELIHMATLLHDDIIDESPKRRHSDSPYKRFGIAPTLITGDFLLARAFGLCAHLDLFVIEATETACIELTEGEVLEGVFHSGDEDISFERYLTVIRKKTASLFGLGAAVGAHIAEESNKASNAQTTAALKEFGYLSGMAFQMVDDILDITAEEDLLGKPTGTDLRQKTPSLINVLWMRSGDVEAKKFFALPQIDPAYAKEVAIKLRDSEVVREARKIALKYAGDAKEKLFSVPANAVDSQIRAQMSGFVDTIVERCS
jgi:geranylgeranyl pyrophosphate synthase